MRSDSYAAIYTKPINHIPFFTWLPFFFTIILLTLFICFVLFRLKEDRTDAFFAPLAYVLGAGHYSTYFVFSYFGFYLTNIDGITYGITPASFVLSSCVVVMLIILLYTFHSCGTMLRPIEFLLIGFLFIFSYFAFFFFEFVSIFLIIEIVTLVLYTLASMHDNYNSMATLQYAIFSMISAAVILFGAFLVYVDIGTLNFLDWETCTCSTLGATGFILLFTGLLIKVGSFPFTWWALDVYTESSDFAIVIYTVFTKVFILGLFLHIFVYLPVSSDDFILFGLLFFVYGIGSVTVGIISALACTRIRDLIICSGFVPLGYFLISLSTTYPSGAFVSYLYVLVYSVNICFLFFLMFYCVPGAFSSQHEHPWLRNISDFTNIFFSSSWIWSLSFLICIFSLIGLPPTIGFVGKVLLTSSVYYEGYIFCSAVIFIASTFSAFYYLRVLRYAMSRQKGSKALSSGDINFEFTIFQCLLLAIFISLNLFIIFAYPFVVDFLLRLFF
jgi:NADH-quinone oxidoreductase subunit N